MNGHPRVGLRTALHSPARMVLSPLQGGYALATLNQAYELFPNPRSRIVSAHFWETKFYADLAEILYPTWRNISFQFNLTYDIYSHRLRNGALATSIVDWCLLAVDAIFRSCQRTLQQLDQRSRFVTAAYRAEYASIFWYRDIDF